jgi:aminodeoxyfutalosine synthase
MSRIQIDNEIEHVVGGDLAEIAVDLEAGRRLTIEQGHRLYDSPDIWGVCALADRVRRRLHGDVAYYNINQHINYSNVCALSCRFCEFYRKRGDDGAYEMSLDDVREQAAKARDAGATELHIVGGLHPYLPFEYYTDMCRAIREVAPKLHIKAFTAVEIVHFARISKRPRDLEGVLRDLRDAGLGSLPGGGAEVFDERIQKENYKGKIKADAWLDVHRTAHRLGLNTNATMLYGHVDSRDERLRHLDILRTSQDEALARLGYAPDAEGAITLTTPGRTSPTPDMPSGYTQAFIPLPFFPDGSELEHLPGPDGMENLRTLAVARLMLDNFPHIKAFWIMQTLAMSQLMLQCGADDIDGTVVWYDITKVGGADTHQETSVWDLRRAIVEAGFEPVERDTIYRRVERGEDPADWSAGGAFSD